ncbi:MAG TPA: DM13 domain-containing protein [Candidatus Limnocylindrales bacterium]
MRRRVIIGGAIVALALMASGLHWYQPWKLFTSRTIIDTPPASSTVIASGALVSHEHTTSGKVELVRLPDGKYQVILRELSTSDGPDLRVWLTDQPVIEGRAGWDVFDDGKWVELGRLKGTHGLHVYDVPPGTDVTRFKSVTIWCKRFSVSFGAAPLTAT